MSTGINNIIETLIEEVDISLPDELKHNLQSMEFRRSLLEKHGAIAFIDPTRMKFPVYDLDGPNCKLLYAAYIRSAVNMNREGIKANPPEYYKKINIKAKKLFSKHNCSAELNIHLHESDNNSHMDYIEFTELFEYSVVDTELAFIYIE
jgi:hypothetical protein